MFPRLRRPEPGAVSALLAKQASEPFSYEEVGATRADLPDGYDTAVVDVALGRGEETFRRARHAIETWAMFELGWVRLHGREQAPAPGVTVAVVARVLGLWSVNVARVVYVIDEPDRFGFAYGTLPAHAERGEELFAVARAPNGEVTYEIRVFSRPQQWWSHLGKPIVAGRQARFREDSCAAMARAVASASP